MFPEEKANVEECLLKRGLGSLLYLIVTEAVKGQGSILFKIIKVSIYLIFKHLDVVFESGK